MAVVGASEKAGSIGSALMKNLIEGGFPGTLLPVNPKYETVHGMPVFGAVSELEAGVDLAVIAAPIQTVPGVTRECVAKKMAGAVVISAGGGGRQSRQTNRGEDPHRGLCRRASYRGPELLRHHSARRKP